MIYDRPKLTLKNFIPEKGIDDSNGWTYWVNLIENNELSEDLILKCKGILINFPATLQLYQSLSRNMRKQFGFPFKLDILTKRLFYRKKHIHL